MFACEPCEPHMKLISRTGRYASGQWTLICLFSVCKESVTQQGQVDSAENQVLRWIARAPSSPCTTSPYLFQATAGASKAHPPISLQQLAASVWFRSVLREVDQENTPLQQESQGFGFCSIQRPWLLSEKSEVSRKSNLVSNPHTHHIAPSSFSFAISPSTSSTLPPPWRAGGSTTLTVLSRAAASTP